MKNTMLVKAATLVCVAALLILGLGILFKTAHVGLSYADAERYDAGGVELDGTVKSLDIHWLDGEVNLAYHDKATVLISETAPKAISADAALRWWLDGDTLRVQYAKSGYFSLRSPDKALTVTLPRGTSLESASVSVTSGDVNAPALEADRVKVELTSGDLHLSQSGAVEVVELSCTSGDLQMALGDVGKLTVSGTSGNIEATLNSAKEADISTASGRISLIGGSVAKASLGNTSGGIQARLAAFEDLRIESTSGSVSVALPTEPGYRADVDTISGRFDCSVPLTRDGDAYVCGDGNARLEIEATSGNVRIDDINE